MKTCFNTYLLNYAIKRALQSNGHLSLDLIQPVAYLPNLSKIRSQQGMCCCCANREVIWISKQIPEGQPVLGKEVVRTRLRILKLIYHSFCIKKRDIYLAHVSFAWCLRKSCRYPMHFTCFRNARKQQLKLVEHIANYIQQYLSKRLVLPFLPFFVFILPFASGANLECWAGRAARTQHWNPSCSARQSWRWWWSHLQPQCPGRAREWTLAALWPQRTRALRIRKLCRPVIDVTFFSTNIMFLYYKCVLN